MRRTRLPLRRPLRGRGRLLPAVVLSVVVVGSGLGLLLVKGVTPSPLRSTAATQAALPAPAKPPTPPSPATRPAARPVAAAAFAPALQPARASPAAGVEVCGFGAVQPADDDPYPLQRVPPALRQAAIEAAEVQLLADPDARIRAAGLLIGAGGHGGRARIDSLARLAAGSQDALVYALALQACQGVALTDGSACQLLSRAQAARLEPDNAPAWLALAAEAAARGDAEAEHDAMRRAAQARRFTAPLESLPALVGRALAPPHPALQRTLALAVAFGLHDAWRLLPAASTQARAYCASDAATAELEAQRGASCRSLAQLLLDRGATLADLGTGIALARRWGLPADVLAAPQQEHDALLEAGESPPDPTELGCVAQAAQQAWADAVAQVGERRAMRERLQRQGRSLQEWSERHRRTIALAAAAVEAAAEGDSTPR